MNRPKLLAVSCLVSLVTGTAVPARAAIDPRDSDSAFGMLDFLPWDYDWAKHHYDPGKIEKAAALMEEAGVGWIRLDFVWSDVEPTQGKFQFAKYDRILKILEKHGIRVLGILNYNPAWRDAPWNSAPILTHYVAYAEATVRHFKDRVRYWEVWNEPDSKTYWVPQDDLTAYAQLLKATYTAIKKEDPTSLVVLGGMTEGGVFSLRRVYQKAGKDSFDIVNIHPFVNPTKPTALKSMEGIYISLMRVMKEFGDEDKPIWFTELGCPGVKNPTPKNSWWHGLSPTEAQQAEWVTQVYGNALQWKGVQKVFWAFFRETPNIFKCGVDQFGLVYEDFSKKPAFEAYRKMAVSSIGKRMRQASSSLIQDSSSSH